jgi:hypothetical protein
MMQKIQNTLITSANQEALKPIASASNIYLIALDESYDDLWDELVVSSAQGNRFILSKWLKMLVDTSQFELRVDKVGCIDSKGKLLAGWVIPYKQTWRVRRSYGFGLRFSGPLLSPEVGNGARKITALSLLSEYARANYGMINAENHPTFLDLRVFLSDNWIVVPNYMHVWDLTDPDAVFRNMNGEKRREVRRGLEAYNHSREELSDNTFEQFITLYQCTMELRHQVSLGGGWINELRTRLMLMAEMDGCRLYTARSESGELMAGLLVLMSPEDFTAYYWMAAYDQEQRDSRLLPSLYWYANQDICASAPQIKYINLGVSPQRSLSRFKDMLGAEPTLFFTLLYQNRSMDSLLLNGYERVKNIVRRCIRR